MHRGRVARRLRRPLAGKGDLAEWVGQWASRKLVDVEKQQRLDKKKKKPTP
eukprot:gene8938-11029_t